MAVLSAMVGSISAFFLWGLSTATTFREEHLWIMVFLPFAGVFIVWLYQTYGGVAQRGNNLLLEEYYRPDAGIPLRMAPMIIATTLITHLFGGSAGREGSAVQYGATIANQMRRFVRLSKTQQRILLLCGIASGFSSLFGTPLAGIIFAIEMVQLGRVRWRGLIPVVVTSFASNWVCGLYGDLHTHYPEVVELPHPSLQTFAYLAFAGLIFGLAAQLFTKCARIFDGLFKKIKRPILRPVVGGILLILAVLLLQTTRHIGLGIPVILSAFQEQLPVYDFFIKIVLTTLTLSAGFKGGEVTPLFFIGATLGNALALFIPLPLMLLAATGFVAVFSGCTKTPLACTIMAMELFGWQAGLFFLITCLISYLVSGQPGIYEAQRTQKPGRLLRRAFRS